MARHDELRRHLDRVAAGRGAAALGLAGGSWDPSSVVWTGVDNDAGEPAFPIYSVTKTFLATLVLLLHETGRVSLEEPLARWYPAIDRAGDITVRHLLRHTSGLPDYGGVPAYHEDLRRDSKAPWSDERFAAETYDKGLWFEPGRGWAYSNPGYALLRRIAENAGEADFATLVERHIAKRLGLTRTRAVSSLDDLAPLAPGLSRLLTPDLEPVDVREAYDPRWVFHGLLSSTVSDVLCFYRALFGGDLLAEPSLAEMTTLVPVPGAPPPWAEPSYGMGLMADPGSPWGRLFGHNGEGPGYTASVFHAPDFGARGTTVCVLCSIEEGSAAEGILRATFDWIAAGAVPDD